MLKKSVRYSGLQLRLRHDDSCIYKSNVGSTFVLPIMFCSLVFLFTIMFYLKSIVFLLVLLICAALVFFSIRSTVVIVFDFARGEWLVRNIILPFLDVRSGPICGELYHLKTNTSYDPDDLDFSIVIKMTVIEMVVDFQSGAAVEEHIVFLEKMTKGALIGRGDMLKRTIDA